MYTMTSKQIETLKEFAKLPYNEQVEQYDQVLKQVRELRK